MKRALIFIVISLLLFSLVSAKIGMTSRATEDLNDSEDDFGNQDNNQNGEQNQGDNSVDAEPEIETEGEKFCGTSTFAACERHINCMRAGCSNSVCQGRNEEPSVTTCEYGECYNNKRYNALCGCIQGKCQWTVVTKEKVQEVIKARNRIKASIAEGECPEKCTCTGSVTKCMLANGTREMTIRAGKSGNIIVQVKGVNASTKVVLYKSEEGKLYGVFKGNKTKIVRMLPDQVREKIRERLERQLENEDIELNEDGTYDYQGKEKARLFAFIPVRVMIRAELNPETGQVIKVKKAWWAFLTRGERDEEIVGASCGTVTPSYNDECCKNKGYDVWNVETSECEFAE